jgi:hypothetical protein
MDIRGQSTLITLNYVYKMGDRKNNLIPTCIRIQAINTNPIDTVGAIILCHLGTSCTWITHKTPQICYVSPGVKGFYLSKQGYKKLQIIPDTFPMVSTAEEPPTAVAGTPAGNSTHTCDCQR